MNDTSAAGDLTIEKRDGYLYTRIDHPTINRKQALEVLAEIVLRCADHYCKYMLIERDTASELDDAEFNSAMRDLIRFSPGIKIAFVNTRLSPDRLAKNVGHLEDERSAVRKYFDDQKAAEQWLLAE